MLNFNIYHIAGKQNIGNGHGNVPNSVKDHEEYIPKVDLSIIEENDHQSHVSKHNEPREKPGMHSIYHALA